jgi:hypothetical protein
MKGENAKKLPLFRKEGRAQRREFGITYRCFWANTPVRPYKAMRVCFLFFYYLFCVWYVTFLYLRQRI